MLEDSKAGKKQQDSGAGSCKTSPDWKNTSLVAQLEKNLPEMQETRVRFLGWEDPLEKEMAIHSSILAWEIPWIRGAWRATAQRVAKSQRRLSNYFLHFQESFQGLNIFQGMLRAD